MNRWTALAAVGIALTACTPPQAADTGASAGGTAMTTPAPESDPARTPQAGELGPAITAPELSKETDTCGASKVRELWTGALLNDEIKTGIARAVGERPIRYYREGDAITMDYSDARLNVVLGKDGRIVEFGCG